MIARTDQKQETRRRIVESAARALRERGLEDPSVAEVMAGAGLTVGGFYAHFENKDALMLETLRHLIQVRMDELVALIPNLPGPERRALAARWYLSRKHRDGQVERCPLPAVLGELNRLDPRFTALVAEHFEAWVQAMHDPDEPDGRAKALAAIATMIGALTMARALGATPFSDDVLATAKAAIR